MNVRMQAAPNRTARSAAVRDMVVLALFTAIVLLMAATPSTGHPTISNSRQNTTARASDRVMAARHRYRPAEAIHMGSEAASTGR